VSFIPISFQLGPLTLTLYGLGLAIAFTFGAWLIGKRLRERGEPSEWVRSALIWVIVWSLIGARAADVLTHLSQFSDPVNIIDFWHGGITGLSSFGGLLGGVPAALIYARRHAKGLRLSSALDAGLPALVATWGLARLVACDFMYAAGGPVTHAWYGIHYHGQVGARVPVPLIQAAENWALFGVLLLIERALRRRERPLPGVLAGLAVGLYGLSRALDEFAFFFHHPNSGTLATTGAGLAMFVVGLATAGWLARRPLRVAPAASSDLVAPDDDAASRAPEGASLSGQA
jgi:phosphatidylglycerol:prolipoprotein diacylglycerol transferase